MCFLYSIRPERIPAFLCNYGWDCLSWFFNTVKARDLSPINGQSLLEALTAAREHKVEQGTDFRSTVLTAINLGEDTDTVGALTGAVAAILIKSLVLDKNRADQ